LRCLITGINGFVGSYLARALIENGHEVWGTAQPGTSLECLDDICHCLKLLDTEITDPDSISRTVNDSKPERVFHLAAQSHVPTSWADPVGTFRINVEGTLHLLQAAANLRHPPHVLLVSSGDVYGSALNVKGTVKESSQLAPLNPYAASKAAAEMVAFCIGSGRNLPIVTVRPFNHIGPGQSAAFVTADFARQIARIEAGLQKPLMKVGDLTTRKDFTDVRDMVRAYIAAIEMCPPLQVFNICSGKSYSIKEVLEILLDISGVDARVMQEKKRLRATRSSATRVDSGAFRKITGWKPKIPLRQTLSDILDYWREKTGCER